jgi:hypothetical protein
VHGPTGTYDIPVVIDSPNQQAQDDINLPAVLQFIARDLPAGMQLIVGLETATDYPFDMEVHLTEKFAMLTQEAWEPARALMEPLLEQMYAKVLSQE